MTSDHHTTSAATADRELFASTEPFPDRFEGPLAEAILAAARSTDDATIDALVKAAFLRGKAEVRLALDAVAIQTAIRQQRSMVRLTWALTWVAVASAIAAIGSAIAAFT